MDDTNNEQVGHKLKTLEMLRHFYLCVRTRLKLIEPNQIKLNRTKPTSNGLVWFDFNTGIGQT